MEKMTSKSINKKLAILLLSLVLIVAPIAVSAQGMSKNLCVLENGPKADGPNLQTFLSYITCIIGRGFIPLVFAAATVMFVYGVVQYVIGANEEKERTRGKQFMIWGIVAIAVMLSVWGLVGIVTNTFGFKPDLVPHLKQCGNDPC